MAQNTEARKYEIEQRSGVCEKTMKRPRGGRSCIYMDSSEVKACKELGFELEDNYDHDHQHNDGKRENHSYHLENEYYHPQHLPLGKIIISRPSLSSQFSTSTGMGDNSPIHNWRISSPGDDPRDVKARLKAWAQAVALESTSQLQE